MSDSPMLTSPQVQMKIERCVSSYRSHSKLVMQAKNQGHQEEGGGSNIAPVLQIRGMSGPAYAQPFTRLTCRARVDPALSIDHIVLCLKSAALICSSSPLSSEEYRLSCTLPDMPGHIEVPFIHSASQLVIILAKNQRINHCITPLFHFQTVDV